MLSPRNCSCAAVLLSMAAMLGCSGSSGIAGGSSEPWRTPKYPPHAAVSPSVPPSAFSSGPPYDWETQMPAPPRMEEYRFANTRTLQETTAWIKKTMDAETATPSRLDPTTRFSDIHFEGCVFQWHETQGEGTSHVNAYSRAVNLAHARMTQIMAWTSSFRVGWEEEQNTLFHAWDKRGDDPWSDLGERLEKSTSRDFPASSGEVADRLRFAFIHAARLCGAKPPEH